MVGEVENIPFLLAINLGTVAMLVLAAATMFIRQRHFNEHGRDAILVAIAFITAAATLRFLSTTFPEVITTDINRLANGWFALVCAARQVALLTEAEFERKARELQAAGHYLLEGLVK